MHFLAAETVQDIKENKVLLMSAFVVVMTFSIVSSLASISSLSKVTVENQQGSIITSLRLLENSFLGKVFFGGTGSTQSAASAGDSMFRAYSAPAAKSEVSGESIDQGGWTRCATENQMCNLTGTQSVRYGSGTKFVTKTLNKSTYCSNSVFGDPARGITKSCYVLLNTQSTTAAPVSPVATTPEPPASPVPTQVPATQLGKPFNGGGNGRVTVPSPTQTPPPTPAPVRVPVQPSAPVMPTTPKPTLPPVAPTMPNPAVPKPAPSPVNPVPAPVLPATPNIPQVVVPVQPTVPVPTVVRTTPIAAMTSDSYPNPFETYPPILTAGSNIVKNLSAQPLGLGCELMRTSMPSNKKKIVVFWKSYNATAATVNGKNALSNKAVITSGSIYSNEIAFSAKTATSFELVVSNGTESKTCRLMVPVAKVCTLELIQNEYVDQRTVDYKLTVPVIPGASYVASFSNYQKKFIGSVRSSQILASSSSVVLTGELSKTYFPDNYKFQVTTSVALADVWTDNNVYTSSCTGMYTTKPTPIPKTPTLPTPKPVKNQGNNEGGGDRDRTPSGTGGGSPTGSGGGTPSGTGGGGKLNNDNVHNNSFGNVGQ